MNIWKYLTLIILPFTISACGLRVTKVKNYEIFGTLRSEFIDSISFLPSTEISGKARINIVLLTKEKFVKVMPNNEFLSFINDADSSFRCSGIEVNNSQNLKEAFILNSYLIDSAFVTRFNLDYILVLDSLVDNFNGFVRYYFDNAGNKHLMPTICYPDTSITKDDNKFEEWKKQFSIFINPMSEINSNPFYIEIIYGYAITKIYSGKDGSYLGDLKIFISDFDINPQINYEFSSKTITYNQTKTWVSENNGKFRKVRKDLDISYDPNGLFGLFSFGGIYGEKTSRILRNNH